jgi:site-specific DNA-methyltransferase (adenine-specific)/adenine-specific DNA-methyltransferase
MEVRFPLELIGKQVMAVFVDIYGNEAREVIPASQFGVGAKKTSAERVKKVAKKTAKTLPTKTAKKPTKKTK